MIGGGVNRFADAFLGGWTLSGIVSARTGFAFGSLSGAFPLGFNLNSPAIPSGDPAAFKTDIHTTSAGTQYFADPVRQMPLCVSRSMVNLALVISSAVRISGDLIWAWLRNQCAMV